MRKKEKFHTPPGLFSILLSLFFLHTFCKVPNSSISAFTFISQLLLLLLPLLLLFLFLLFHLFLLHSRTPFSFPSLTEITPARHFCLQDCISHVSSHRIYFYPTSQQLALNLPFSEDAAHQYLCPPCQLFLQSRGVVLGAYDYCNENLSILRVAKSFLGKK